MRDAPLVRAVRRPGPGDRRGGAWRAAPPPKDVDAGPRPVRRPGSPAQDREDPRERTRDAGSGAGVPRGIDSRGRGHTDAPPAAAVHVGHVGRAPLAERARPR